MTNWIIAGVLVAQLGIGLLLGLRMSRSLACAADSGIEIEISIDADVRPELSKALRYIDEGDPTHAAGVLSRALSDQETL